MKNEFLAVLFAAIILLAGCAGPRENLQDEPSSYEMQINGYVWGAGFHNSYDADNEKADLKIDVKSISSPELKYTVFIENASLAAYSRGSSPDGYDMAGNPKGALIGKTEGSGYVIFRNVSVHNSVARLCYWYMNESDKRCTTKKLDAPKIGFEVIDGYKNVTFYINASRLAPHKVTDERKDVYVKNTGDVDLALYPYGTIDGAHWLPFERLSANSQSLTALSVAAYIDGVNCRNTTSVLMVRACKSKIDCPYKGEIVATTICFGEFNMQDYEDGIPANDTVYLSEYSWEGRGKPPSSKSMSLKLYIVSKTDISLNYTISIPGVDDASVSYSGEVKEGGKHYGVLDKAYTSATTYVTTPSVGVTEVTICFWRNESLKKCIQAPLKL